MGNGAHIPATNKSPSFLQWMLPQEVLFNPMWSDVSWLAIHSTFAQNFKPDFFARLMRMNVYFFSLGIRTGFIYESFASLHTA